MQFKTLDEQNKNFIEIIKKNNQLMNILKFLDEYKLPNFYLAAGSVYQTIWNYLDNRDINCGIEDIDIIYFDENHLTIEEENKIESDLYNRFAEFGFEFDIHNEARMSIWRKPNENPSITSYMNSEDTISQWLTTVQAVGVTMINGQIKVFAPYGLSDIFSKTIRPVKLKTSSKELYDKKVASWQSRFSGLHIIEW